MKDELLKLLKEHAYRKGEFKLSSGKKSEHYVNCKPVTLSAQGINLVSTLLLECISSDVVAVGGLTLGADPLVVGLSQIIWGGSKGELAIDALIVRKKQKGYGANAWIEGKLPPKGSKVVVLEDVTTTGGSALIAVEKLRDAGYEVDTVVSIIDRQENDEANEAMKVSGLQLKSIFTLDEVSSI